MIIFMTQEKLKKKFKDFMIADLNRAIERKQTELNQCYRDVYEKKVSVSGDFGGVIEIMDAKDSHVEFLKKRIEELKNEIKLHKIMFEALGSYVF